MEPWQEADAYIMQEDKRLEETLCRECQYCSNIGTVTIHGKEYEVGYCEYVDEFLNDIQLNQTMKEGGCV